MDFKSLFCDEYTTIGQLETKLSDYCVLHMKKRSVDERLGDFAQIMKTPLSQKNKFNKFDESWKVSYTIGPVRATVKGFNKSLCINECKQKILQNLILFSTAGHDKSSPERQNESDFANIPILVNESKVQGHADERSPEEPIVQSSATLDNTAAAFTAKPKQPFADYKIGSYKQMVDSVNGLLDNVSNGYRLITLSVTSDLFSALVVAAYATNESYLKLFVDMIVLKAVCMYDDFKVFARLCAEVVKNMSIDKRPHVQNVISKRFKMQLLDSCIVNLWGDISKSPRILDLNTHIRCLNTCRFIGQIFILNDTYLDFSYFVSQLVDIFVNSCDAISLECLCALLTVVGSNFEEMNWSKYSLNEVYEIIETCRARDCSQNDILPKRTISMLDDLIRLRKQYGAK